MLSPDEILQRAFERHQAGAYREAAAYCRQILDANPRHREALHLFAISEFHAGRTEMAVKLLDAGLRTHPTDVDLHNSLGVFLRVLGRHDEAERHLRLALELEPDAARVWNNLGILLRDTNRLEDAIASYRTALRHDGAHVGACFNLANALWARRDLAGAAEQYRRTLELDSTLSGALASLGSVLLEMGNHEDAEAVLRQASTVLPDSPQVASDLGCVLMNSERTAEAEPWLERAVSLHHDDARSWYALGCIQLNRHDYATATQSFRESLRITPDHAETQHNLGSALCELGEIDAALKHFHKAISLGKVEMSLRAIAVMIPAAPLANNARIHTLRRAWAERFAPPAHEPLSSPPAAVRRPAPRLRIGYLSSFFDKHNWMKPVWSLINAHDRQAFEIHLFSDSRRDAPHLGYRPHESDTYHEVSGANNFELCECIRKAGIDCLVDLNAYSRPVRLPLLALRPAPVVAAWFNMYGTSAIDGVDYIVGDAIVAPEDEDAHYSETVIRLPLSYLTFSVDYPVPDVQPPPCQRNGYITFGSLASQYKITPPVLDAWAKILNHTNARLVLRNATLKRKSNRRYVLDQFERRNVDPRRIQLEGPGDHFEFLKTYERIDLALDTFPYNGGTTTMESLWQGVPVLTYLGDRWVARTSASLLASVGLDAFVQSDCEHYCRAAVELAGDRTRFEELAVLRSEIRNRCASGDSVRRMCEAFEAFLRSAIDSL